ncbi:TolC family protein [Catalinimonas niigatensis]|uniref:TolC family protein n=1 Tax=Catalinimonas niigatensis TaxID=1397264 RepID=UPI0026671368|nr:TolC family protein [Catalinimonas niigatensis]WPP52198.1 TolC family protein [Catalinimonas niigatensis]
MNKLLVISLSLFFCVPALAQDSLKLSRQFTLPEIVAIAKGQSPQALLADTRRQNFFWQYRTFLSDYRPEVYLSGTLPGYLRTNDAIRQPDGSYEFRRVNQNLAQLNLGVRQQLGFSGGEIFVQSELQRFDNFENEVTTYSGNPAVIGLNQPLFGFNELKWAKEVEPLRYDVSKKSYVADMEQIAVEVTGLYFDVLLQQINLEMAEKNRANNDTIYQISEGRYNLGKIGENDLLQVEYNVMTSRQDVAQARLDLETSTLRLRSFLGLNDNEPVTLAVPGNIPDFEVEESTALSEALQNHPNPVDYVRQIKEAEREVARAKGNSGLQANLYATYGLTNRGDAFSDIYYRPENQQRINIQFDIPIVNWGRQKARVKTAEADYNFTQYSVDQDRINFEQQVYTQVKTFKMLRDQVEITRVADDIANRRFEITKQRYLIGKISNTDLSIALQEKDQARRQYLQSLRDFWTDYYTLRSLTLYDFEKDQTLLTPETMEGYK